MRFTFESALKPTERGVAVPYRPGLVLFSTNKPCRTCGRAAPLELKGVRVCRGCWKAAA